MRFRNQVVVVLLMPALALAACSGKPAAKSAPSRSPSPSPSASASPTKAAPPPTPAPKSPLTGLPGTTGRVVALKIDNSQFARPFFTGLDRADVVYEELVEGGTTRMLAIFGSKPAPAVGPIRSVRESDLELLAQYGRVLFGFSGGNKGVLRSVAKANVVDVSYDAVPSAYIRGQLRPDAYNFFTSTGKLLNARPKGGDAKDVGFRFGAAPAPTAPATGVSVSWSARAKTDFTYDAASGSWLRSMDGRPTTLGGARLGVADVIVQYVNVRRSIYTDVNGENSPYTATVGSGRVQVFRDGQVISGTWHRPNAAAGTRFLDANKRDIPLRPGRIWVLLAPTTVKAVIR